jgi:hypothetical protein
MALEGIRHLIECHCTLPQFRNANPPVYHKFVVFSVLDEDSIQKKLVQCNNCGILHKIVDLCKSEIAHGMEEGHSLRTAEDIKLGIPDKLATFLTQQNADISMWEYVEFILDNKQEREVILKKEQKDELTQLKILHIKEDGTFKVKNETRQDEWSVT